MTHEVPLRLAHATRRHRSQWSSGRTQRKALRAPARLADRSGAGVRARPRAFAAQAVEQLRSSEGWEEWPAARRLFTRTALPTSC